jgi:uncharacterized membrane protein YhaH (DUF805 family)
MSAPSDFGGSVRVCLEKYTTFQGRAARPEFWWWVLFVFLVNVAAQLVAVIIEAPFGGHWLHHLVRLLLILVFLLPNLAVSARRLHDTGQTAWLLLLGLIPVIGWIVLIVLYVLPGQPAANRFGPPTV